MASKMSVSRYIITAVALLTFIQCKVNAGSLKSKARRRLPEGTVLHVKEDVNPKHPPLAGELTPVYLAYKYGPDIYYKPLKAGIVKEAFDYLRSENYAGLPRVQRSVNDNDYPIEELELNSYLNRSKRDTNEMPKYYYPSLLVTMEHKPRWPENESEKEKAIYNKILYALAYWNEVEIQLRRIRNPGLRIHIAAIIIGHDGSATPANVNISGSAGFYYYESLNPTLMYWQRFRTTIPMFSEATFNVVATMMTAKPTLLTRSGHSIGSPVCDSYDLGDGQQLKRLTGLMVYDDEDFGNIKQAIAEMSHIMGRSDNGMNAGVDASSFTKEDLEEIKNGLRKASCWEKPLESLPIGKPVERLFRTDLIGN